MNVSSKQRKGIAALVAFCLLNFSTAALARDSRLISPPVSGTVDALTIRKAFQLEKDPTVSLVLRNQPVEFILRGLAQKANLNLIFMVDGVPQSGSSGDDYSASDSDDPLAALERQMSGDNSGGGVANSAGTASGASAGPLRLVIPYLELKDIPVSEAFSMVMRLSGLTGRRVYNSILISTPERMEQLGFSTPIIKTYTLYNQFPTQVMRAEANLGMPMQQQMQQMPMMQQQGANQMGWPVMPLPIAQQLTAVFQSRGVSPQPKLMMDQRTSTLIVIGTQEAIDIADAMIPILDRPLPQVVVEIKLIELTQRASQELGVSYGFGQDKMGASFNNTLAEAARGPGNPLTGDGEGVISFNSLNRFAPNFNARLNALIRDSQARVLTNPRLTIQHGITARFDSTTQFPILSTTTTATTAVQTVQTLDIGETLEITPFIDVEEGVITMQLMPNISTRGEVVSVGGQTVPERNTRSLSTVLRVPDGDSVIIGGLMRKADTETRNRIPLLGDIPLLGALFSDTQKTQEDVEIVIMVTPRILQSK
ncbi:MAG: type II and III secretion system protein [Candidatus Sericytochromatia bacterium]|nr:type II and III secretion system protein [Candidatus Sericytochromatia bacterium]